MENDKENSEGVYDFGKRNYDSRLGHFFNRDHYAKFLPNKSPYTFAGDNPILFIDADGGFQIIPDVSCSEAQLYTLRSIAIAISNMANSMANPLENKFVTTFMQYAGLPMDQNGADQALKILSYGSGPVVIVTSDPRIMQDPTRKKTCAGFYGGTPKSIREFENFVFINDDEIIDIATKGGHGYSQGKLEGKILALITLWHEGGHFADYTSDWSIPEQVNGDDVMDHAEQELFGFHASMGDLDKLFKGEILRNKQGEPTPPKPPLKPEYSIQTDQAMRNFWTNASSDEINNGVHVNKSGFIGDVDGIKKALNTINMWLDGKKVDQKAGSHGDVRNLEDHPNSE